MLSAYDTGLSRASQLAGALAVLCETDVSGGAAIHIHYVTIRVKHAVRALAFQLQLAFRLMAVVMALYDCLTFGAGWIDIPCYQDACEDA